MESVTRMDKKEGFPKTERLSLEKDIETLFRKGKGFNVYPFRVVSNVRHGDEKSTCRVLISVSKKRFHHAVKRNRIKRLVRESWRRNKMPLIEFCTEHNITLNVALIYTATVIHSYEELSRKLKKVVKEIISRHEGHQTNPS